MFKPPFQNMFAVLMTIFTLHLISLQNDYYWLIWWYDIMMHFLGGVWVVLVLIWLNQLKAAPAVLTFKRALTAIIVVGLAWEIYELLFDQTFIDAKGYGLDTVLDLITNTVGATAAYFLYQTKDAPM